MPIEKIHGFDWHGGIPDSARAYMVFSPYVATPPFVSSFSQGGMFDGRFSGKSFGIFNTSSSENSFTDILTSANRRVVGIAIRPTNFTGVENIWVRSNFLRFQIGNATQIAIQIEPDGRLQLVRGTGVNTTTPSQLLGTFTNPLATHVWRYLEVDVTFAVAGRVRAWLDGALVLDQNNLNTVPFVGTCDRVTPIRWQDGSVTGMLFDDMYIASNQDRLGPSRVRVMLPTADFRANWTPSTPGAHYLMVDELGTDQPDMDSTRLTAPAIEGNPHELFGLQEPDCIGRIWAVGLNVVARRLAAGLTVQPRYLSADGTEVELGPDVVTYDTANYWSVQGIAEESPDGEPWNPVSIRGSAWGMSADPGVRVTAVNLEVLSSLDTAVPFDCGGQSYAY